MEYIYLPNTYISDIDPLIMFDTFNSQKINLISYHISRDGKYPFVQIMLEKIPSNSDQLEQFVLPSITLTQKDTNIGDIIVTKINQQLKQIRCLDNLTKEAYKGIFCDDNDNYYALIDVSLINIQCLYLTTSSKTWFALSTEMINIGSICNIPISEDVIKLFNDMPELGVLYKNNLREVYILPDAVYTGCDYKKAEFQSLFGPTKEMIYYYFFHSFSAAVKEGGWAKAEEIEITPELVDTSGKYVKGAINRYALFFENSEFCRDIINKDLHNNVVIFDQMIEDKFASATCIVLKNSNNNPNILVKEYEFFQPLSFHSLNKDTLGEIYDATIADKYMIS
jgi:hypothetical protein